MEKRRMTIFEKLNKEASHWFISDFEEFERKLGKNEDTLDRKFREQAIRQFSETGFPNQKVEEWKYTNLLPLLEQRFRLDYRTPEPDVSQISQFDFGRSTGNLLVFVNGHFSPDLSRLQEYHTGIVVTNLRNALRSHRDLVTELLERYGKSEGDTFDSLNRAFADDGFFIYLPENVVFTEPVHILHISDPGDVAYHAHPRNMLIAGAGSRISLIETHRHLSEFPYFHNAVTTGIIGTGAAVDFYRFQDSGSQSFLMNRADIYQQQNSRYNSVTVDLGGRLVRNNLSVYLEGEHSESHLYGFYFTTGKQLVDNHTDIEHQVPNCESNELYKGILTGQSRGVFSGLIHVLKDAQRTRAFQANRNLLLSDDAEVDTKPQLKIFADDVKCSHGAAVGQMDEEALFYLEQRGINKADAQVMLRFAFAAEVLEQIKFETVRESLREIISERFKNEL